MKPRVWIERLTFNNGRTVTLDKNDITVFVGPNNAGKSASLKEIHKRLQNNSPTSSTNIMTEMVIKKEGDDDSLNAVIESNTRVDETNPRRIVFRAGNNIAVYENEVLPRWQDAENGLQNLIAFFVLNLDTEGRLGLSKTCESINFTNEKPSKPVHFLYKDNKLEHDFSEFFRQAFGSDLMVHPCAGNVIPLYVGKRPALKPGEQERSKSYIDRLEDNEKLEDQGDGMRSFVGVLLS